MYKINEQEFLKKNVIEPKHGVLAGAANDRFRIKNSDSRLARGGESNQPGNAGFSGNRWLGAGRRFAGLYPFLERAWLSTGSPIYRPGDLIDYVYFPESAVFSEFQVLQDGRMIEISMSGRDSIVGLLAIFDKRPVANWTEISFAGNVLRIPPDILRRFTDAEPSLREPLFSSVNDHLNHVSQRVVCNAHHSLEERFCTGILMLQEQRGSNTLLLTQERIGRLLGAHRPSVTIIAQELRTQGIIDYTRGNLRILNKAGLESKACDCRLEIANFRSARSKAPMNQGAKRLSI